MCNTTGMGEDEMQAAKKFPLFCETTVTMDNWYSSPELMVCLGYAGTCARATFRADKLLNAPVLNNKDLGKQVRGFTLFSVSDMCGVLLTRWQDNACVTMLTNCNDER